jgi:hypothetical protein
MGYLPYWEMKDATVAALDYGRLTTIAFFSVGIDAAGHLDRTGRGYDALMSDRATGVITAAHAAGVRTIVSFSSFGAARNQAFFSNPDAYAATAGALTARLRAANPIAFTTVATNANVTGSKMAARALAAGVGYAFLMGYDYRIAGSTTVGSVSPLVRFGGGLSLAASLDLYAGEGVPLDRVVLGLPLYGRTWQTADAGFGPQRVAGTSGEVFFFRDLAALQAEGTVVASDIDNVESSSRLVRDVDGLIYQTYYDTPATVAPKFDLVASRGLAGIGFWALGYEPDPAWWDLVGATFGAQLTSLDIAAPELASELDDGRGHSPQHR